MNDWALIIYCGLITFFTRFSMIALLKKEMFNDRIREVLSYVPSAVFPSLIFPAVFYNNTNFEIYTYEVLAFLFALIAAYFSKNILVTVTVGLLSYIAIVFII